MNGEAPRPCRQVEDDLKHTDESMEIKKGAAAEIAAQIAAEAKAAADAKDAEEAAAAAKKAAAEADAALGESLKGDISRAVAEHDFRAVQKLLQANGASPAVQSLCCGGVWTIMDALVTPEQAQRQRNQAAEQLEKQRVEEDQQLKEGLTEAGATFRAAKRAGQDARAALAAAEHTALPAARERLLEEANAAMRAAASAEEDAMSAMAAGRSRHSAACEVARAALSAEGTKEVALTTKFRTATNAIVGAVGAVCAAMAKFPEEEVAAAGAWALCCVVRKLAWRNDLPNQLPWSRIACRLVEALRCSTNPEAQWRAMAACEAIAGTHGSFLMAAGGLEQVAETMLGWPGDGNLSAFRKSDRMLMVSGALVIKKLMAAAADKKQFATLANTAQCPRAIERAKLQHSDVVECLACCRELLRVLDPAGKNRQGASQAASGAGGDAQPPAMTYLSFSGGVPGGATVAPTSAPAMAHDLALPDTPGPSTTPAGAPAPTVALAHAAAPAPTPVDAHAPATALAPAAAPARSVAPARTLHT